MKLLISILFLICQLTYAGDIQQNKSWERVQVFYPYDTVKEIVIPCGYTKEAALQAARAQADWLGCDAIIVLEYERENEFSLRVEAIKWTEKN